MKAQTENPTQLFQKIKNLEAGDPISYELLQQMDNSELHVRDKPIYQDSVGFLESWKIGEKGEIVIDAMNGELMVRKVQHIEEEIEKVRE